MALARDAVTIQAQTATTLKDQGHQIGRMQNDMDIIHNNLKQSERKLRSIESPWGSFKNKVTSNGNSNYKEKANQDKKRIKKKQKERVKQKKIKEKQWEEKKIEDRTNSKQKVDPMISRNPGNREVGSQEEQFYATTNDTEETLDELTSVLGELKKISEGVSDELNYQNESLDALLHDVNKADCKTSCAIKRSRAILHS